MASEAQIEANRANALLSTGPSTPAGIDNSKYNATRHGLTGKQVVVKGEDPAAYDALRAQLVAELTPASELEAMLVEEIAQNWWRLERARRCESDMLDKMDLAAAMSDRGFLNLQRYMARIERSHARARKDLAALQVLRRKDRAAAVRTNAALSFVASRPISPGPQIGSVSQPAAKTPDKPTTGSGKAA